MPDSDGLSSLKRIGRHAGSILLGSAAGEVLAGYAVVLAALALGPSGFGLLSAAQAFIDPFDMLAGFGLAQIVITVAAQRGGCDETLRGTVLVIRGTLAVVTVVLSLSAASLTGRQDLLPVLFLLCVNTLLMPFDTWAVMPYDFEQTAHRRITFPFFAGVVRLTTAYAAYSFHRSPVAFQASSLAAGLSSIALNVWAARRHYPARFSFDRALGKKLLWLAWPAAILEVTAMTYLRGAYFLMHAHPAAMGEYAAAEKLVRPILTIGGVFIMSSLPTMARMAQESGVASLRAAYVKVLARMIAVLAPIVALAWLAAPFVLHTLVPSFSGAVWPFRVLTLSILPIFLTQFSFVIVVSLGRLYLVTVVAIFNALFYFTLASALIPRYSASGAAVATTVMESVNTVLQMSLAFHLTRTHAPRGPSSAA